MTTEDLLDGILAREGGGQFTNAPTDRGGPTRWGITSKTLGAWRNVGRPATIAEVKALTEAEARQIYRAWYVRPFDLVPFDAIKAQLADFGVTSGTLQPMKALQRALGLEDDGRYGPKTNSALLAYPWRLTNNALVAQRVQFYLGIVNDDAGQLPNLHGWVNRACQFIL